MKCKLFLLLFLSLSFTVYAQDELSISKKYYYFSKVWGYLKYYHPKIAKGEIDWDLELIKNVEKLNICKTKNDLNIFILEWVESLGKIKKQFNNKNLKPGINNMDLSWIIDTSIFCDTLIQKLVFLKINCCRSDNQYISFNNIGVPNFDNENKYEVMKFPSIEYRILALCRFWNIINYFYPYKYLIDNRWDSVLVESIPCFLYSTDTLSYQLCLFELVSKIGDSHMDLATTKQFYNYFGNYWAPFRCKILNDSAIVSGCYSDSLCLIDDILRGDIITHIDGVSIKNKLDNFRKYTGASNAPTMNRKLNSIIFSGSTDYVLITYLREGFLNEKQVHRYKFKLFHIKDDIISTPVCSVINNNIGYVNLGRLYSNQVDSVMQIMIKQDAIIFDIRNYPNGTLGPICNYLISKPTPFVKFTFSSITHPGYFEFSLPKLVGKINPKHYKGEVVILVDERTQSHGEFTSMALQTYPDIKVIGSQTAGADGDAVRLFFPGGYYTYMTSIGVYYPDGKETQKIGIIPDIYSSATAEGIKNNIDEVLIRAIDYIQSGK